MMYLPYIQNISSEAVLEQGTVSAAEPQQDTPLELPAIVARGGVQLFMDVMFPLIVNQDFAAKARQNFLKGGYQPMDPDHPHLNLMRNAGAADWGIDWSALTLPTLNITGLQDRVFLDPEVVERLYAKLPDARREDWADCGHLIPIERPERLAESLARFGAEIEARR